MYKLTFFFVCLWAWTQLAAQKADLLVVNKIQSNGNFQGNLAFVNLASGKVIDTVSVSNEPHEVAISDDKKYALVTNTGSYKVPNNKLSLIDVVSQKEIYRVDLGPLYNPHGAIFSNGLFYFTAEGARAIGAYDPYSNKLVWINGTGQDQTHMLVMTKEGKTLVCTNRGSGTISISNLKGEDPLFAGAWKEIIIPVGKSPEGLALNPDGTQVWIGLRNGDGIVIVDLLSQQVKETFPINGQGVARVKFTSDGKYLLATDPMKGEVLFIDATSHQIVKSVPLGKGCEPIFLEPDGSHILVGVTNENYIAEISIATMEVTRKIVSGKGPDAMVWIGK
jgi:DNA-binding beta-propeller fold protein YncE